MSDITLVNLNMLFVRYSDTYERERHLPLGPLYLVTALEAAGYSVDFRDYQLSPRTDPFEMDAFMDFMENPSNIIGLSCMANLLPFTILAAGRLKEKYPDAVIIVGGVGAKAVEERVLQRFNWIDIVAHGEGELSAPVLLRALRDRTPLRDVPGIAFRDQNRAIVVTPPAQRIENLDQIGRPAYHRIRLEDYDAFGMISSRGCPYQCSFCSVAPVWNRKCYFRSPADVVDEMKFAHENFRTSLFLFQDEFFVSSSKAVKSFCSELKNSGLKIQWKAFVRVDLAEQEMLEEMAATGCIEVRFGIESGSSRVLQATRKGFTPEMAVDAVSRAVMLFPRVDTFFIWGYPDETTAEFKESLFQMISFRLMGARILPSLLCLLPQTGIYQALSESERAELTFCEELLPEYMMTGHEICSVGSVRPDPRYERYSTFIGRHPDIFPGFFLRDLDTNIRPKLSLLREHGFYMPDKRPCTHA